MEQISEQEELTTKSMTISSFSQELSGLNVKQQLTWNKPGVALAYMLVPALKAGVDVIAETLSSIPMVIKDADGKIVHRSDKKGSDSKFLKAISRSYKHFNIPMMQLWAISKVLYGEVAFEKVYSMSGELYNFRWLNSLNLSVDETKVPVRNRFGKQVSAIKRIYKFSGDTNREEFTDDDLVYFRSFNPLNDYRGYSDALSVLGKANISLEFENFVISFFGNSGNPGMVVSPKDKITNEKDMAIWRKNWESQFRGSRNFFKTYMNQFPFDVFTFPIADVEKPLQVTKDSENKILVGLKVPPEMVGDTSNNAYQFSKEKKNAFVQVVIRPLGMAVAEAINNSDVVEEIEGSGFSFGFDFSEFENVTDTDLKKQELAQRTFHSTAISLADYKKSMGAVPLEGDDDIFAVQQGIVLVNSENIVTQQPVNMEEDDDRGRPSMFDSMKEPRRSQSITEDPNSIEFFSQKANLPGDYSHIDFSIPGFITDALSSEDIETEGMTEEQLGIIELIPQVDFEPDIEFVRLFEKELYRSGVDGKFTSLVGGEDALTWAMDIIARVEVTDSSNQEELYLKALEGGLDYRVVMELFDD